MSDYEAKTHYQSTDSAKKYEQQFAAPLSLFSLRIKLVGLREEREFRRMLQKIKGATSALDIACGTGRYLKILIDNGLRTGGSDISNKMLSYARQHLNYQKNSLFLQQGDAENLPFNENEFDLVTCMRLYHRVPTANRLNMLYEVKRVGIGNAILFFGMETRYLKLRRSLREKFMTGRSSNPYPLTHIQLFADLELVGMNVQDTAWVLPLLADGLLVRAIW